MSKKSSGEGFQLLDAHNDSIILREARGDPMDFAVADRAYHVDLPRMRKGNMGGLFVMVGDSNLLQSLRLIDAMHGMCAAHPEEFALCLTAADVRRAMRTGRVAIVMSIEAQVMFAERVENVRNWHRLGVRVASLTHGEGKRSGSPHALQIDKSFFGYLTPNERRTLRRQSRGLTPFARDSLDMMAELGIPCDVAHVNDQTFWETLDYAKGQVCYTHGNCYALCPHSRNLTDEMMKALAERDGVMGISFFPGFVDEKAASIEKLADHFLYALDIMGPDHVGVGSDFDGIALHREVVIRDAGRLGDLWEALARRGIPRGTLTRIAHKNFLRLLP